VKTRFLLVVFFVAARAAAGPASEPAVEEPIGRLLQVGIMAKSGPVVKYETPETSTGFSRRNLGPTSLVTPTNRIPAVLGITFGFYYEVTNLADTPGKPVEFFHTVVHPPMNVPGRGISKGFTSSTKRLVRGRRAVMGYTYTFDYPYELLPGLWEIQIAVLGKTVVRQSFMVVPPVSEVSR
jgi:Domain of unknown function (DUF3859)